LAALPAETNFRDYDMVCLTGGEPMLYPDLIYAAADKIREQDKDVPIILYTACTRYKNLLLMLLWKKLDGLTVTLHGQGDVVQFLKFHERLMETGIYQDKSLRLNIFKGVELPAPIEGIDVWRIKDEIEWIENCPLPDGEVFRRYEP
jgi:hypothetical protein